MPCWFYDKKALFNTPSIQDGIDHKTECQYRKEGAQLIIQIGSQMELGYNTLATGIVYFHRFYMFHSFRTFSPYITACCCLFLAGKAEETPKKSKDIIRIAKTFLSEDKLPLLGEDPREEVMTMEKILLQTMKFDLRVRHPYCFLLKYAKCLKGDKRKKQKMVQMAWTFINDSLCTTLSIQWEPEVIAIAVMHLAGKLVRFKVNGWAHRKPSQTYWWEIFVEDLSLQVVEDICHQVLDLYSPMSRYEVVKSSKPITVAPKNSISSQSDSPAVNRDMKVAMRDPRLENGNISVIANPALSLKDPRLESGSVFVKSHFEMNTLNTPVLVASSNVLPGTMLLKQSPSTPTAQQFMDQSLQDNSHFHTNLNTLTAERELQENSRLPFYMGSFNTPTMSSSMDPLANVGQQMVKKGFNSVDNSEPRENRSFGFGSDNNNDYNDNRSMNRRRGFGCMHNNNRDDNENRPMRNRGFRNHGRINYSGFVHNRFKRRNFENNNHSDGDDRIENRPFETRGFGNSNDNNKKYDENKTIGNRGFGNANDNSNRCDENKPLGTRGFRNANCNDNPNCNENSSMENRGFGNNNDDNGRKNENNKLLMTRGFGNSDNYNNNYNDNDSRRRMRFNRGNRFQRSGRRFNNNYENDRYSHNNGNRDTSKDSIRDAPGKIVDKQRFYHPSPSNEKAKDNKEEEEESWD